MLHVPSSYALMLSKFTTAQMLYEIFMSSIFMASTFQLQDAFKSRVPEQIPSSWCSTFQVHSSSPLKCHKEPLFHGFKPCSMSNTTKFQGCFYMCMYLQTSRDHNF